MSGVRLSALLNYIPDPSPSAHGMSLPWQAETGDALPLGFPWRRASSGRCWAVEEIAHVCVGRRTAVAGDDGPKRDVFVS